MNCLRLRGCVGVQVERYTVVPMPPALSSCLPEKQSVKGRRSPENDDGSPEQEGESSPLDSVLYRTNNLLARACTACHTLCGVHGASAASARPGLDSTLMFLHRSALPSPPEVGCANGRGLTNPLGQSVYSTSTGAESHCRRRGCTSTCCMGDAFSPRSADVIQGSRGRR